MLPILIKLRILTAAMAGWTAAASPVPLPAEALASVFAMRAATPVEVALYDENHRVHARLVIDREGNADAATTRELTHLFRCRQTEREKPISPLTLKMLVDLAERHEGHTIEFVSAYRGTAQESRTSPHRAGRAIDFRVRGVPLREVRDYLWRTYRDVGIGWYPEEQYIHMDARPGLGDTAWTFQDGENRYDPYWAAVARRPTGLASGRRPGS